MTLTSTYDIISKKVLNEASGELETTEFKQVKTVKSIRGGFYMMYKSYEETVESIISSKLDFTILLEIKNQFTYQRIECVISASDICSKLACARSTVNAILKKMVDSKMLLRVGRGTYRLNPFMCIPFRSDGQSLQSEWNTLIKQQEVSN